MLAGVPAGAEEEMPESERIGPYDLERVPEGLEIRSSASLGRRGALAIAAGLCIVAGIVVSAIAANSLPGMLLGAVGLALAVAAGAVRPGADRVRISATSVTVEGFVGQQGTTAADALGEIQVQRRTPTGPELKRSSNPRVWQVTLRERSGDAAVVRFRLASRAEALSLAARIGGILDRPVVEREGIGR